MGHDNGVGLDGGGSAQINLAMRVGVETATDYEPNVGLVGY